MSTPLQVNSSPWFCVRVEPKHEHIAAGNLRKMISNIEVFNPRFRVRRSTRRGPVWFNEPLFPGYLLARFDVETLLQRVMHVPSVRGVIRFGHQIPPVPDELISELRKDFDSEDLHVIGDDIATGDAVEIAVGPFQGARAVVMKLMSGPERVQVLMEMLGQSVPVEVSRDVLIRAGLF